MSTLSALLRSLLWIVVFTVLGFVIYFSFTHVFVSGRLYYDGLIATSIAAFVFLILIATRSLERLTSLRATSPELFSSAIAALFLVYSFHVTLPTIIDRSISLYVLSRIDQERGVTLEEMHNDFLAGYVSNYDSTCRRLEEQLVSGNVELRQGRYHMTQLGAGLLRVIQSVAGVVGQDQYYVTRAAPEALPYRYRVSNGQCLRLDAGDRR